MLSDVENMRRAGLGKGGSLDNALVYDNGVFDDEGGLRMDNECVKHKALRLYWRFISSWHAVKGKLISKRRVIVLAPYFVQKLLRDESAYRIISADDVALTSGVDHQTLCLS